jgi:hypothetical protein
MLRYKPRVNCGFKDKGMIYSPAHGDIAFTVPLFEEFLLREITIFSLKDNE